MEKRCYRVDSYADLCSIPVLAAKEPDGQRRSLTKHGMHSNASRVGLATEALAFFTWVGRTTDCEKECYKKNVIHITNLSFSLTSLPISLKPHFRRCISYADDSERMKSEPSDTLSVLLCQMAKLFALVGLVLDFFVKTCEVRNRTY